jgi:hypothetical protein
MIFRRISAPAGFTILIVSPWILQGSRLEQAGVDSKRHIADD